MRRSALPLKAMNRHQAHTCLVKSITDYLLYNGAWVFKVAGGLGQRPGVCDVLACLKGRFVAVEAKTGRGELTDRQEVECEALRKAGAIVIVCRCPEDLEARLVRLGLVAASLLGVSE